MKKHFIDAYQVKAVRTVFERVRAGLRRAMPAILAVVAAFLWSAPVAQADTRLLDGFNYSIGILGTNAPWTFPTNVITVANGGLVYPGLAPFSPAGNQVSVMPGPDAAFSMRTLAPVVGSGTSYVSFLINYSSVNANVYIAGLLPSSATTPGGTADPCDLVVKLVAGGFNLGIRGTGQSAVNAPTVLPLNTTHFVVMKYDFSNRRATLYLNPSPNASEPATPSAYSTGSSSVVAINKFFFRSGGSAAGSFVVDSLRAGTTWADVTPNVPVLPASKLAFAATPSPGTAGKPLRNITVQVRNPDDFNVATNNLPITLTLSSGSFASGITTLNCDATGKAVFSNLVVNVSGTYTLTATASNLTSAVSDTLVIGESNSISEQGRAWSLFLDSLQVEKYWANGYSVNWLTGATNGNGPNMTQGTASHCSAFAAAVARLSGIYLLGQPDASDLGLANVQADWLLTNTTAGWFNIPSHVEAQHLANAGVFVLASLKESGDQSGHIAILRPSEKSDAEVDAFGPQECQSGISNYNDTEVSLGFAEHADPMARVRYYGHYLTNAPPPVNPRFRSARLANGAFQTAVTTIAGRKYDVQWTTDFVQWFNALSFTNPNDGIEFYLDSNLPSLPVSGNARCYRLLAK